MIITDIQQLRKVPVGEVVTLVMQFKVIKADQDCPNICKSCVFDTNGCCQCSMYDRPDEESVKFVKI